MIKKFFAKPKLATRLLQFGLAFVFLYAALASFLRPADWVGYLPSFLKHFIPAETLLKLFSLIEIFVAVWLLSSWKSLYAALFAALMFLGITLTNLAIFDVTFRDVALLLSALALASLSATDDLV